MPDTRALEVIAEETDAQVLTLSPIEEIRPMMFKSGATYLGKMKNSVEALKTVMPCQ